MDEKGFLAPYGMTTAERRHPEFRTRGVGKCEWDGAIWPFASAQTLTAMAFMNNIRKRYSLTVCTSVRWSCMWNLNTTVVVRILVSTSMKLPAIG